MLVRVVAVREPPRVGRGRSVSDCGAVSRAGLELISDVLEVCFP
jgi:hypothetical protein